MSIPSEHAPIRLCSSAMPDNKTLVGLQPNHYNAKIEVVLRQSVQIKSLTKRVTMRKAKGIFKRYQTDTLRECS